MWFVYILRCSDKTFYTGITNNLERRLRAHNTKKGAKYTRSRTPVKLVYVEKKRTRVAAMKRELAIKRLTRKQKMKLVRSRLFAQE